MRLYGVRNRRWRGMAELKYAYDQRVHPNLTASNRVIRAPDSVPTRSIAVHCALPARVVDLSALPLRADTAVYLCYKTGSSTGGITDMWTFHNDPGGPWYTPGQNMNEGAGAQLYMSMLKCGDGHTNQYEFCDGGSSCYNCRCKAGYYTSGGCHACPAGRYSSSVAKSSPTQCIDCAPGKHTNGDSAKSSCSSCPGGKYAGGGGTSSCATCAAGRRSTSSSGSTSCTDCPSGKYSSSGVSSCSSCPK